MDKRIYRQSDEGMELRLERTAARIQAKELAARMGRNRNTVLNIEGRAVVAPEMAAEYRRALASLVEERAAG
jgi:transcriptional regulator with XRE-family HTH domain